MQTIIASGCSRLCCTNKSNVKLNNSISNNDLTANHKTVPTSFNSDIETQLSAAAKGIEKSLAILAAAQEMNNVPVLNTAPLLTPEGGMGSTADIDWTGPIEPLLEKIASMSNYNLKILGSPPSIPIIISITQTNAIIADILKNASLQAGKRVNIVVFPANKIIELRYKFGSYNSSVTAFLNNPKELNNSRLKDAKQMDDYGNN